jgi:hypothetical protein
LNREQHSTKHLKTNKMKNLFKFVIVACGFMIALTATSSKSKAAAGAPKEGCVGGGHCGTTTGGTELTGKWQQL